MKNLKFASLILLLTIVSVSFTSCSKYPDGPIVSLVSRAERVANNWKVGQAFDDGKDVTANYNQYEMDLTKAGAASLTAKYTVLGVTFDFTTSGTWSFISNFEKITFDFDNNSSDGVYKILRLTENEMWLKEDAGTLELHYVTQ
ncbi:MAG: hypothetical protein GZ091_14870 [Paludibacter sp.]|nr:hypothetical protein [Paludibacter sp.]